MLELTRGCYPSFSPYGSRRSESTLKCSSWRVLAETGVKLLAGPAADLISVRTHNDNAPVSFVIRRIPEAIRRVLNGPTSSVVSDCADSRGYIGAGPGRRKILGAACFGACSS
jgi:hypothetical protein